MPSFGTPEPGETLAAVYDALAALVNPRRPFVGGVREPYAALHLSQQAETFYFARRADRRHPQDYWLSVFGWHNLLVENQLLLDVAFDGHLTPADLSRYPVFVAPLSVALSDAQIARFARYVAEGGVLVAGPWFGARDAWGCPAEPGRVAELLGHAAEPPPSPDRSCAAEAPTVTVRRLGAGAVIEFAGNPGLAFHANHSPLLAREVGRLIRAAAPPRLDVRGPRGLNVGLYRKGGRLLLHLHNALAYSEAEAFEKPYFLPPRPARGVRVRLRGYPVVRARRVLARGAPALKLKRWRDGVEFVLPRLGWGDVIALEG
jgi:hypothetical protein